MQRATGRGPGEARYLRALATTSPVDRCTGPARYGRLLDRWIATELSAELDGKRRIDTVVPQ